MNTYKVIFANNEPISSQVSGQRFDHDSEYYYELKGQVMYAMVKANNEETAKNAAKRLISNINLKDNHIFPPMSAAA
jgi:hypothetical protein